MKADHKNSETVSAGEINYYQISGDNQKPGSAIQNRMATKGLRGHIFRLAPKGELGLRPESRPKQSGGDEKLRKQKAKQSAPLADSTGRTVEVIELIVYFARVGTVVV